MEGCVNGKYYIETNTYTRAEGNFYRQIRFNKKKNNKSLEGPDSESSSAGNHQRRSFKLLH